jgi:hypothetical protein
MPLLFGMLDMGQDRKPIKTKKREVPDDPNYSRNPDQEISWGQVLIFNF